MSRLRWTLVALLVTSTALFAAGVIAERSDADTHAEPASVHTESVDQLEAAEHREAGEEQAETDETLFGIDVESTPLVVLAVIAGLALAAVVATRLGTRPGVLAAIAVAALAWAALDAREAFHQLDESHTDIAVVAIVVALLHLAAAAVAARLAAQATAGSTGRADTMRA